MQKTPWKGNNSLMVFVVVISTFVASLLTLFSGFGLGTLLMPIIALFFPLPIAITLTACIHLLNSAAKSIALWRAIHWKTVFIFGIPALLAAIPGAWLMTSISQLHVIYQLDLFNLRIATTPIKIIIGLLLIFLVFFGHVKKLHMPRLAKNYLPLWGTLSGFFGGFSGHQGAIRSLFIIQTDLSAAQFIATSAFIASVVDAARLIVYGLNLSEMFAQLEIPFVIATIISALTGILVGRVSITTVTITLIQKLVATMIVIIGFLLLFGIL